MDKEVFEKIKRIYDRADSIGREIMENEFPELAESEDERIRKEIVGVIQKHYPNTPESYRWISWLEKQKEQKPADLPPGFYFITPDGKRSYSKEFRYDDMKMKVAENDKPVEHLSVRDEFNLDGNLKTKPAGWSEDDFNYYDTIVRKLEIIGDDSGLTKKQIQFLREHCPSNKQEWSEEDEKILDSIINLVGGAGSQPLGFRGKQIPWLKDLRNRLRPQVLPEDTVIFQKGVVEGRSLEREDRWKPTEEQMKALKKAWLTVQDDEVCKQLALLWNDLYDLQTKL